MRKLVSSQMQFNKTQQRRNNYTDGITNPPNMGNRAHSRNGEAKSNAKLVGSHRIGSLDFAGTSWNIPPLRTNVFVRRRRLSDLQRPERPSVRLLLVFNSVSVRAAQLPHITTTSTSLNLYNLYCFGLQERRNISNFMKKNIYV